MVIWVIGLSGSGKTFLSNKLKNILNENNNVIHIDGDEFRKYISYDLGYNVADRRINSKKIQDLSRYLEKLGYVVIVSILSIFNEHQKENKDLYNDYFQIYIKSDIQTLKNKNNKNLYSKDINIVGKDIKFKEPVDSNYTLYNEFNNNLDNEIKVIATLINGKLKKNTNKIT